MFSKETWWREWKNNQFKTKIEIKKELISSMFRSHHSVQLECIITFDQSLSCSHISLLGITICYISILFFSAPFFFFAFFLFPKHAELGLTLTILPFLFWDAAFLSGSTRDSHAGSFSSSASWVKALSSEGFPVLDFKPLIFFHTPYSTHMLYFVFVTLLLIFITWYFILDEYSLGPQIQQNASQWKEIFFCVCISLMITCGIITGILEKAMATRSSILAWRIPWTEEPARLQSMGSQRVGHDWATNAFTLVY